MDHFHQRDAQVGVQFHDQGDDLGAELHAGSPQRMCGRLRECKLFLSLFVLRSVLSQVPYLPARV